MSNALSTLFEDIAKAIRSKTGDTATMKPAEFPAKIVSISVGSGGSSGGGVGVDTSDANLKYFAYQIDDNTNSIIIYRVLLDKIYNDTGSYDVSFPAKLGGYDVIISSE